MTNSTAVNFGYPDTKVAETGFWLVVARPKQPTFGSLVLICKEEARAFSDLSPEAHTDLGVAVKRIEAMLGKVVGYEKINYLMLMMVDPDVHFHVVPRYSDTRTFEGVSLPDAAWPGPPDLSTSVDLGLAGAKRLAERLRQDWPAA